MRPSGGAGGAVAALSLAAASLSSTSVPAPVAASRTAVATSTLTILRRNRSATSSITSTFSSPPPTPTAPGSPLARSHSDPPFLFLLALPPRSPPSAAGMLDSNARATLIAHRVSLPGGVALANADMSVVLPLSASSIVFVRSTSTGASAGDPSSVSSALMGNTYTYLRHVAQNVAWNAVETSSTGDTTRHAPVRPAGWLPSAASTSAPVK
mmetsp:Transcript_7143/g.32269  ORF Transcript_7143/g.32269 Transcript_7143/m.32269 type:complete len:211 (-) Transcript_7143:762-1394(-)